MFVGYPIWWLLGLGDLAFPLIAVIMLALLARTRSVQVPPGFAVWMLFLIWMIFSVIEIDTGGRLIGFAYRAALYAAVTIIFLYVYNARSSITARYAAGVLTLFWLVIVAGGYLGVFFPLFSFSSPLGYVVPESLQSNELVSEMIVRRVTQYNPDSYLVLDPRPSAPFLYTNGWGNAYSMLMPFVIGYLTVIPRTRRFWLIIVAIPISFVPAFLTLNRGMFLGLGVAIVYAALHLALRRQFRAVLALLALVAVIGVAVVLLPVEERLTSRVETSSTTEDRASLYAETLSRTLEKPLFGYGAPRPSGTDGAPSAGTQGQFWMVMFSHGFPGVTLFSLWLVLAFVRSRRARDGVGLAAHVALLVIVVEIFYYGVMTSGLAIAMIAAALTMRPPTDGSARTAVSMQVRPGRASTAIQ